MRFGIEVKNANRNGQWIVAHLNLHFSFVFLSNDKILTVRLANIDSFKLRLIVRKDIKFLRKLRNENRKFFLESNYISVKGQEEWFERHRNKSDDYMFILQKGNLKIGVGAIYNIDRQKKRAELGRFIIAKSLQNHGYGKILIKKMEELCFKQFGIKTFYLTVLANNAKAINLYKNAGFREQKKIIVGQKAVMCLIKRKFHDESQKQKKANY